MIKSVLQVVRCKTKQKKSDLINHSPFDSHSGETRTCWLGSGSGECCCLNSVAAVDVTTSSVERG